MEALGTIVRLQMQRAELKSGMRGQRQYRTGPIVSLPEVAIDDGGVTVWDETGSRVFDVHHRDHPAGKNLDGIHGFLVLFTRHYSAMRERFGEHLADGVAGESVLVDADRMVGEDDLRDGIAIQTAEGTVRLYLTKIAEPCVEFTRFATQRPPDMRADPAFTEALDFLRQGMRGFYLRYAGEPMTLRVGNPVFIA